MKYTFFYLDIIADVIHADLWQQLVFIGYLFQIKTYLLCKIICTQHNTISKTMKITHRVTRYVVKRIIHKQKLFMGVFLKIAKLLVTVFYHSMAVYIYIHTCVCVRACMYVLSS